MRYWIFLALAILTEVVGTLAMKWGQLNAPVLGLVVMYVMLIVSYMALAMAVKRIPITVAYGAWESLGLVLIALMAALLFNENLGLMKISAIVLMIVGIVLLERGTASHD
ncbi:spermidine export protein MdtJ [Dyella lipolytica]|uniref:Spermidine export protein MdtJ n=1 Tax=Dyella lipolytica TaxID=1867835 RepID=A0ABW8IUE7_9GAMM|nr:SMR family transporter [Dyella lipolytica]GLQ46137.1 spermidine export protein MdtJ [Dyella lipolytica]